MSTQAEDLKLRTKRFALRIIKVCRFLPRSQEARVIGNQLLRSGTSVGANYWAACRARSRAEFASKVGIVVEEGQETVFWLELLVEAGLFRRPRMQGLLTEANELLAIFVASQITARSPR